MSDCYHKLCPLYASLCRMGITEFIMMSLPTSFLTYACALASIIQVTLLIMRWPNPSCISSNMKVHCHLFAQRHPSRVSLFPSQPCHTMLTPLHTSLSAPCARLSTQSHTCSWDNTHTPHAWCMQRIESFGV